MLGFVYISLKQRRKSLLRKNDNDVKTIIFADDYEKFIDNGVTRELYYIGAPDGLAAIYVKPQIGQANMYYAHKDHLGSIVSLTDSAGVAVFKASYDAWGKQTVSLNTLGFYRGYTGHEHLPEFGLINMNGRMYGPVLGRFLSHYPFIQDPANTQSYNRYSYCLNNPLTFNDPSGEIIPWFYFAGQLLGNYLFGVADNSINKKMPMNQAAKQFNFNMSYSPSANRFFMPGVDAQMSTWNMETSQRPAYTSTGSWRQVNAYAGGFDDRAYQYTTWKYIPPSEQGGNNYAWAGVLAFAGTAAVADGPIPIGDAIGGTVVLGYGTYVLADKMTSEITRIYEKVNNTQGFTYELRATTSGSYPNVRGGVVNLNAGDVWKYGETTQSFGRYSENFLRINKLEMVPIFFGNVVEIKVQEKIMIYGYYFQNGTLPPGNRIFR